MGLIESPISILNLTMTIYYAPSQDLGKYFCKMLEVQVHFTEPLSALLMVNTNVPDLRPPETPVDFIVAVIVQPPVDA